MDNQASEFLAALAEGLPEEERMILCGFRGDPNTAPVAAWRPRPWRPGRVLPFVAADNVYVTVASFLRAGDGSFRRRKECFGAGRALMVDDVGTKVDPKTVEHVPPSAIVETSAGNFQWWYWLAEPERDEARYDGVIRAFISGRLLGVDPGMSGITRVGRVPGFTNGKPSNNGWRCALREMNAQRFSIAELLQRFSLSINGRFVRADKLPTAEALERNRMFASAYKFLTQRGMLKRDAPDPSGWTEMRCPWVGEHTAAADTGAAIREPNPENEYYGAFRCHHGHCADRGWAELTEWINDAAVEELDAHNAAASDEGGK